MPKTRVIGVLRTKNRGQRGAADQFAVSQILAAYIVLVIGDHSPPISHPHPPNRSILTFSVFQLELITALYRAIRARFRCIRKAVGVSYHRFLALIIIHRRISPNSCLTLSGLGRRLAEKLISIIINRRSRTFSSPAGLPCLLLPAGVAPVVITVEPETFPLWGC
jgi:hypothetical protein